MQASITQMEKELNQRTQEVRDRDKEVKKKGLIRFAEKDCTNMFLCFWFLRNISQSN